MTFISAALLGVALLALPQAPEQRAEAERLARAGAHAEALKQFQALAAANPDDIEARLWIARLHAWMGNPERATAVYQSIVATQPQNVDALIGVGEALTTSGRLGEAADALDRAEALAPDRPAVLTAQGRLHRIAGRPTLALAYYERALALEPGNTDARVAVDALRAARAHRVVATYDFERFSTEAPDTHAGTFELNGRVSDAFRVFGVGQYVRKFSTDEGRGGGGFEWTARDFHLRAGALFGSDTLVIPDSETAVTAGYRRGTITWLGAIRYLRFSGSSTFLWSPGITLSPTERVAVTLRYYHSRSDFEDLLNEEGNDSFSADVSGRLSRRVSLQAGYARGFEALDLITSERFSQFDADNLSAGILFDASQFTSIAARYRHQWRDGDTSVATATVNLIQRF